MSQTTPPVFIICRDRLTGLVDLVDWLERTGCERIYFVDNESAWPPLLEYYEQTPHTVVHVGWNGGHRALWSDGIIDRYAAGEPYVVTDPDVVPVEDCPHDALLRFRWLLDRYPGHIKAGFGLVIDDLPDHFAQREDVVAWERQFWRQRLAAGVFHSPIDATFALYPANGGYAKQPAMRTGPPYVARHLGWYLDSQRPTEEEIFYRARASSVFSTWNWDEPPEYASRVTPFTARDRVLWWLRVQKRYRYGMWRKGAIPPRWASVRPGAGG